MTVLACNNWPTNAELIADVAQLGYITEHSVTLDPTFGEGVWWKIFRPKVLATHDRKFDGTDFQHLDYPDRMFDVCAFDPPYVCVGGRETTGISEMHRRFGMDTAPRTPVELQGLIFNGLVEMYRLLDSGGRLLVKCQDYVTSGKVWPGVFNVFHDSTHYLDFKYLDRFEHYGKVRPQPPGRRQVHARRNHSTLFVFEKP